MDKRPKLRKIVGDERGATAIEYGLICALIVVAMILALKGVAQANTGMWQHVAGEVENSSVGG